MVFALNAKKISRGSRETPLEHYWFYMCSINIRETPMHFRMPKYSYEYKLKIGEATMGDWGINF